MRATSTLAALAALALWSTLAGLVSRLGAVPPLLLVGVTLCLGALVGARHLFTGGLSWRATLLGLYGLGAYHLCLFLALRLAPPVEANLLNYLWPLLLVVLAPLVVPGARLGWRHVAGALVGAAGAALVLGGAARSETPAPARALGDLLAVAAALIWSTYSLLVKRAGGAGGATGVARGCLAAGVAALAAHAALEPRWVPDATSAALLGVLGLGPMGVAFYLWERAMASGDPRRLGTLAYLVPVGSTLGLCLATGTRPSPLAGLALALILGGAALGAVRDPR